MSQVSEPASVKVESKLTAKLESGEQLQVPFEESDRIIDLKVKLHNENASLFPLFQKIIIPEMGEIQDAVTASEAMLKSDQTINVELNDDSKKLARLVKSVPRLVQELQKISGKLRNGEDVADGSKRKIQELVQKFESHGQNVAMRIKAMRKCYLNDNFEEIITEASKIPESIPEDWMKELEQLCSSAAFQKQQSNAVNMTLDTLKSDFGEKLNPLISWITQEREVRDTIKSEVKDLQDRLTVLKNRANKMLEAEMDDGNPSDGKLEDFGKLSRELMRKWKDLEVGDTRVGLLEDLIGNAPLYLPRVELEMETPFDKNGLFYFLGTNGGTQDYENPYESRFVNTRVSKAHPNYYDASRLTQHEVVEKPNGTHPDEQFSWFEVDLGRDRKLNPTCYAIRSGGSPSPTGFVLQASNNGSNWDELSRYKGDLQWRYGDFSECSSFKIHEKRENPYFKGYRYFRIKHTEGPGGDGMSNFLIGGLELYGVLHQ